MTFSTRFSWKALVLIFCASFFVFNANLVPRPNSDAISSALTPFSLVIHHNIYLDDYYEFYKQKWHDSAGLYFFTPWNNHYLSSYPLALPLVVTPLYFPVVHILHLEKTPAAQRIMIAYGMGKICASLFAALSVVALYIVLVLLFGFNRYILVTIIAYALGTTMWSQASQHMLSHSFSCLMILATLAFYLVSSDRLRFLFLAGLCAALAVAERYNNVFFAGTIALFVIAQNYKRPRNIVVFFVGPLVIGAVLLWYNLYFFHNLLGAYPSCKLDNKIGIGLAEILISPSRGLFVYSPFLLASIFGMVVFFRKKMYRRYPVIAAMVFVIVANVVLVAKWSSWWGGWSYGPRLLTEIVPLLVLFIPFIFEKLAASKIARTVFYCSVCLSVVIHGIGVFCYPKGMSNALPKNIDVSSERLWSITNSQILVEARAGLYTEIYDVILRKLTGKAAATVAIVPLPDSACKIRMDIGAVPAVMKAGYSYRIPFIVQNLSGNIWPALGQNDGSNTLTFSCYWHAVQSDSVFMNKNSRSLIWDIAPKEFWHNDCIISAPEKTGKYIVGFDMYQTKTGWFHDKGAGVHEVNVTVIN